MKKQIVGYIVTDRNSQGLWWDAQEKNFYYGQSVTVFSSRAKANNRIKVALPKIQSDILILPDVRYNLSVLFVQRLEVEELPYKPPKVKF